MLLWCYVGIGILLVVKSMLGSWCHTWIYGAYSSGLQEVIVCVYGILWFMCMAMLYGVIVC